MHREDDTKYLLYIEPDPALKSAEPVEDELTAAIDLAMESAVSGTAWYSNLKPHDELEHFQEGGGWKGWHAQDDQSSSKDYLIAGKFITNKIAPHYVRYYRAAIPAQDMVKLNQLLETLKKQR